MKLREKAPKHDPKTEAVIWAEKQSRPYLVDKKLLKAVSAIRWTYVPAFKMPRGTPELKHPRVQLHRFILKQYGLDWEKVVFKNKDNHDLRRCNLRPYDYEVDGSYRKFKVRGLPRNVYLMKGSGKGKTRYRAYITYKGKSTFVGTFSNAEDAAAAVNKFNRIRRKI